jgi:hypothetical protein
MSQLILTEKEKNAKTWVEISDEALGKVVKATMLQIKDVNDEQQKLLTVSASLLLIGIAIETNADKVTYSVDGLTTSGKPNGDWEVTVKRITK